MAQHDFNIANATFPSVRSDINSVLEAINTSNSGTSRPSSAVAGTIWLDTTSATTPTLKFYDGADDISLATLDYTANTVNWLDSTVVFDIVGDTTPQLGGDLDVNGNSLVSTSNGDITFTPNGSGKVVISGLSFPTSDGTADQVLKTDGSGNLSFTDVSGGTDWQSTIVTGTTLTAVAGNGYWIDTTSNACTITLPAAAAVGDRLIFTDYLRTWATNAVTINQNSLNFQGNSSPNPVYDTNGESVDIVYSGATQGWIPNTDGAVVFEADPSYSLDFLVIAGGGGGAGASEVDTAGGGGGAGGYRNSYSTESSGGGGSSESSLSITVGTVYTITVGDGGAGGVGTVSPNVFPGGANGNDSSISGTGITTITSTGGGGGGNIDGGGFDGGSGGGAGSYISIYNITGSGTANQGFNGGTGNNSQTNTSKGGGGGGAGEAGNDDGQGYGGDGLASSITGSSITRAGGGGGANVGSGTAGTGGGGDGALYSPTGAGGSNGTVNTGGGGGGAWTDTGGSGGIGGSGGAGVVILRMPDAKYSGTTTGSPTVATGVGGTDTVLTFNASGSYTG